MQYRNLSRNNISVVNARCGSFEEHSLRGADEQQGKIHNIAEADACPQIYSGRIKSWLNYCHMVCLLLRRPILQIVGRLRASVIWVTILLGGLS